MERKACALFFDESSVFTLPLPTLFLYFPVKKRTPSTGKPFRRFIERMSRSLPLLSPSPGNSEARVFVRAFFDQNPYIIPSSI